MGHTIRLAQFPRPPSDVRRYSQSRYSDREGVDDRAKSFDYGALIDDKPTMAKKPGTNPKGEFAFFNVFYEDGSQRSNRRVPSELLGGLDGDEPARSLHHGAGPRDRGKERQAAAGDQGDRAGWGEEEVSRHGSTRLG